VFLYQRDRKTVSTHHIHPFYRYAGFSGKWKIGEGEEKRISAREGSFKKDKAYPLTLPNQEYANKPILSIMMDSSRVNRHGKG
jgi:hypothetical protein